MKRGDMVTVAAAGDYGKPRPAVIVQTNAIPAKHPSVVICQVASTLSGDIDFRVVVEPDEENGLKTRSEIMADKPVTVRRERIGSLTGRLDSDCVRRLDIALAFVMGIGE